MEATGDGPLDVRVLAGQWAMAASGEGAARSRSVRHERAKVGTIGLALAAGLGGCTESDSWLLDPSVVGRWEHTPTTVPILSRINSIEGPADEWVQISDPTPGDLLPEASEYRLGP